MFLQRYFLNFLLIRDITVLVDLFKHKNVQMGDIYHCSNDQTVLQMYNMFNANNIRISSKLVNQNSNAIQYKKMGVVINASCHEWNNVLDSLKENVFKSYFIWLPLTGNLTDTIEVMSRYKIDLNSDVTIISNQKDEYYMYEVYNTGYNRNGQYIVRKIGVWNGSLYIESKDRKNLKGLVLRATLVIPDTQRVVNKTFVSYLAEEEPDLVKVDPIHMFKSFTAITYFRDMFNITYNFQRSNSWGYPTNGSFDGLVGSLQRLETDIGGSPLFIRSDRMVALDYAAETWLTRPTFIFRHPKHPSGYFSIYSRPLTKEAWYGVILLMTVSAVILGVLLNLKIIKTTGDDEDVSPSLVLLLIWCAICQQGMSISRSSNSIKMVMFTTFLFALTIYQYYNATVVSTLLHEQPKNIKTLQDLTRSSLSAGIDDVLYNKDYFQHTTDPVAREIYLKKIASTNPPGLYSAEHGMAMVKKGMFAFHVDSAVAYRIMRRTFTEKELCELQEVSVFGSYVGLAVTKHSPYKEIIAYGIRKLKEHGILSRLMNVWNEPRPPCVRTPDSSVISGSILELSTPLLALALGYAAALFIFCVELFIARFGREPKIAFRYQILN